MAFGLDANFEGVYNRSEVAPSLSNAEDVWTRTGVDTQSWTADASDPYKFIVQTDRVITFTAFNSIDNTAVFTQVLTDGTEYVFTYDAGLGRFTSPSVGWDWEPPANFSWSGIYPVSAGQAKLTKTSDGIFTVSDINGNALPYWTEGTTAYQQGDAMIFGTLLATYNHTLNTLVFPASSAYGSWTPSGHTIISAPAAELPTPAGYMYAEFVKESTLRDVKRQNYIDFTVPTIINGNHAFYIDPNNVRSINEDVLLAGYNTFQRRGVLPGELKTSVLNLLGHGAPIYITSPDISSLNSYGPQGERGILSKVTGVEDFGRVITHSPFAEMDYFKANTSILKRIKFALRFSSGALVNMHGANWSFSLIFQEAE